MNLVADLSFSLSSLSFSNFFFFFLGKIITQIGIWQKRKSKIRNGHPKSGSFFHALLLVSRIFAPSPQPGMGNSNSLSTKHVQSICWRLLMNGTESMCASISVCVSIVLSSLSYKRGWARSIVCSGSSGPLTIWLTKRTELIYNR